MRAQAAAGRAPLLWEAWPLQAPSAWKVVVAGSALLDALHGESTCWFLLGGEHTRWYSCISPIALLAFPSCCLNGGTTMDRHESHNMYTCKLPRARASAREAALSRCSGGIQQDVSLGFRSMEPG